jgi:hypothetical protein
MKNLNYSVLDVRKLKKMVLVINSDFFLFYGKKINGHFQSSFMGKLQSIENEKFYFSYPTIEEDSKKQKTLEISAVVLKKSWEKWKKSCFLEKISNFEAKAGVVDLKISKSRRTKVVNQAFEISPYKNEPAYYRVTLE